MLNGIEGEHIDPDTQTGGGRVWEKGRDGTWVEHDAYTSSGSRVLTPSEVERAERGEGQETALDPDIVHVAGRTRFVHGPADRCFHCIAESTRCPCGGAGCSGPADVELHQGDASTNVPAGLTPKQDAPMFYIVSLKRSTPASIQWWGPDGRGYTNDLRHAGRYTDREIQADPGRMNNGISSRALPCALVDTHARLTLAHDLVSAIAAASEAR